MNIVIRRAECSDHTKITDLVIQFREEHSRLIGGNESADREKIEDEVIDVINDQNKDYFIAEAKEEIVGYRSWEYRDDFYFTRELFVKPDYREKGIATKLIQKMEKWLISKGQKLACISCVPQNLAMIELARSEGYEILNKIEMRKNLTDEEPEPRDKVGALGYDWDLL